MRRTTLWLWITGGVLLAGAIAIFGGWWALRQWPDDLGPHLPPSLAYAMADWGPAESTAARACFGESLYWEENDFTPAQANARNAVLCAELRGTREQQMAVLDFIPGGLYALLPTTAERDALVFALIDSSDQELRSRARTCWQTNGPTHTQMLRQLTPEPDDRSPLSPDGWVAAPATAVAWQMLILQNSGYDHKVPTKYRNHLKNLLTQLSGSFSRHGPLLADPRDNAVALLAITDAYAMTNDPELKPVVERGRDTLLEDPQRLQRLWREDTTTAVLTAMVYRALLAAGITTSAMQSAMHSSLSTGIDEWWAGDIAAEPPAWLAQGRPVHATVAERWGALVVSLGSLNRYPTQQSGFPENPPTWIAAPGDNTPFGRYLIRLGGFMPPGKQWDRAFEKRRDVLLANRLVTPDHQPPEGFWPETTEVSRTWETIFTLLELGIYRPYTPPTP